MSKGRQEKMAPLFPQEEKASQSEGAKPLRVDPIVEGAKPPPVDPIEEMAGALTDPLIVFPAGGWEHDLPQHLKDRLPLDRLAHQMRCLQGKAQWDEACDLEALLYMYPRTLHSPLSERWVRIYLYLGTKCLGEKVPQDIKQESLSDYDMAQLRDLKRWIQKQKVKARKERKKGEVVVPAEVEQPRMF